MDWTEAQELADYILKTKNPEEDLEITENALYEKWGIDLDIFQQIAEMLFKTIDFGLSPITNTAYVGFTNNPVWIVKKEVDQQFISGLIHWCTDGEKIPDNSKGFVKTITCNNIPEYNITISKPEKKQKKDEQIND